MAADANPPPRLGFHSALSTQHSELAHLRRFAGGLGALAAFAALVLLPLIILIGLSRSPGFDAAVPVSALFGGRSSARWLPFLDGGGVDQFTLGHSAMVTLDGPIN